MRLARLLLIIMLLPLAGCSRATGSEEDSGNILFQDDFGMDTGNWFLETDSQAQASITSAGQLELNILAPNLIAWAELQEPTFSDFVLEVDAIQLGGPDNNSYGIIIRMKDAMAYYRFDISGDGYYAFVRRDKQDGGSWTWITEDWLDSSAIHQGAGTNQIKIVAQGSHFMFYVNGQLVAEADDSTYRSGTIGLNAGSFHEPGVKVAFDNLVITRPE